jgi:hypothetical protein
MTAGFAEGWMAVGLFPPRVIRFDGVGVNNRWNGVEVVSESGNLTLMEEGGFASASGVTGTRNDLKV